jgi:hypothetical protein
MRVVLALLLALALAGCAARSLTPAEKAFAETVTGEAVALENVRIIKGSASALVPVTVPVRPRLTCRERLAPPRSEPVPGYFAAMALGNRVHVARRAWREDMLAGYPERMELSQAMRLAHELVHVWQWQARAETGYAPWRAGLEHVELDDPYLVDLAPDMEFLDYGWEQQGVLVEEYVCCRALDPEAPRTAELGALVRQVWPGAAAGEIAARVDLPWDGAETRGICR